MFETIIPSYTVTSILASSGIILLTILMMIACQKDKDLKFNVKDILLVSGSILFINGMVLGVALGIPVSHIKSNAGEANRAQIESNGVIILEDNDSNFNRISSLSTYSKPSTSTSTLLQTPDGKTLTCKIITDSEGKTFTVQCLNPDTTDEYINLDEALEVA